MLTRSRYWDDGGELPCGRGGGGGAVGVPLLRSAGVDGFGPQIDDERVPLHHCAIAPCGIREYSVVTQERIGVDDNRVICHPGRSAGEGLRTRRANANASPVLVVKELHL